MALTDALDSHYAYVKSRILTINSTRVFGGLLDTQDWPSKPIKLDAFYLLVLGSVSVGKQFYSASVPVKIHQVQWVWINKGTDLQQGTRQANRGTRYRTMQQMKQELLNGLFPGFAEKLTWSLVATGNPPPNDNQWTGTSLNPKETIEWTPVDFHEKWDKDSGIGYGSGAVRITDMTDVISQ